MTLTTGTLFHEIREIVEEAQASASSFLENVGNFERHDQGTHVVESSRGSLEAAWL